MGVTLLTVTDILYEILNLDPSDRDTIFEASIEPWATTISGRALTSAQRWWSYDGGICCALVLLSELS